MADFRRCILAFAAVVLLLGLIPAANAQPVNGVQCIANSGVPPALRSEGLTELAGDIVLNCNGGTPTPLGATIPVANFTIFYNTQVTSRLLTSSNLSEAILTIDEPAPTQVGPATTCTYGALGGGATVTAGTCLATATGPVDNANEFKTHGNPNIFVGTVSGNQLSFPGIPIDPPGTTGTRIYRITNARINGTIPAPGSFGTPGQVIALISITPALSPGGTTPTIALNNPQQIVGFVYTSLQANVSGSAAKSTDTTLPTALTPPNILQCVGIGTSATAPALVGYVNFGELQATAFKTRTVLGTGVTIQNILGLAYDTESGYYNPAAFPAGGAIIGLADFGTRLKAVFHNVPAGVSIFVAVANVNQIVSTNPETGLQAFLVGTASGNGASVENASFTAPAGTAPVQVPLDSTGTGEAVWEIAESNPVTQQVYSFAFYAFAAPSPSTNSPAVGSATVNLSYAPTPPNFTAAAGASASSSLPIPRFIDNSSGIKIFNVALCTTTLLYPYVVNASGFDTGLAISNTSTDPFGTQAQQGTCTLNFYGVSAPSAFTTPSVASGTTYQNLASSVAPGFLGYMIAVCNFQYAHGFAFISDVGARNLAMGYLALIIPGPGRSNGASPFDLSGFNSGEQLGY